MCSLLVRRVRIAEGPWAEGAPNDEHLRSLGQERLRSEADIHRRLVHGEVGVKVAGSGCPLDDALVMEEGRREDRTDYADCTGCIHVAEEAVPEEHHIDCILEEDREEDLHIDYILEEVVDGILLRLRHRGSRRRNPDHDPSPTLSRINEGSVYCR